MEKLRKIDYYGQLISAALMLLSVPVLLWYGFLAGLFIMGCWQLISAAFNTNAFLHSGRRRQIWSYWKLCFADLTLLFLCLLSGETFNADLLQVIFWIAITGAAAVAVYYLKIYNNLIQFISLRSELDGLTKSKH
jgi:hypothetical protein